MFNCHKCRGGWVIYNCISPSALHSCAVSLKDCLGLGWGLSAVKKLRLREPKRIIEIQEPNWVCHLIFFSFFQKKNTPTVTLLILTLGKATFLSRGSRRGKVLFRNSQEENAQYSLKIDRTQALACAIKKTQLSSPSPAVILSVSHLQGLLALPNTSSSPSSTLSATSSCKTLLLSLPLP